MSTLAIADSRNATHVTVVSKSRRKSADFALTYLTHLVSEGRLHQTLERLERDFLLSAVKSRLAVLNAAQIARPDTP